jgi:hypothetical protein
MFGLDRYYYTADKTFMAYRFISNGPQGAIQKIAKFSLIDENLYNFGFGDLDPISGDISDTVVSDNKDVDITVDPALSSFEGHPFFEKKSKTAKQLFAKIGLPKGISKKSR